MEYTSDISCIVLAGGKSSRLGRDKVVEIIGSKSLLQRVVSCLSFFNCDIILVTAKGQSLPQFTDYPKLKVVADIYPGKGSLGGIYTGLTVSESFHNLVVAGDMPFLNRALLTYMMEDPTTISQAIDLILIARFIERIADQATNIAEEVVYLVEAKPIRHQPISGSQE